MKHVFTVCLLLCASLLRAQTDTWVFTDHGNSLIVQSMERLDDGTLLIGGITETSLVDLTTSFNLARVDANGNVLWSKRVIKTTNTLSNFLSVFVSGQHAYAYLTYQDIDMTGSFEELYKVDLDGNTLAAVTGVSPVADFGYMTPRFLKLPNGNLVLMKSTWGRFEMVCFDPDLNVQWSKSMVPDPSVDKNPAMGLALQGDTMIVLTGKADNRLVITAWSLSGQFLYGRRYDGVSDYLRGYNVKVLNDGLLLYGLFGDPFSALESSAFVCRMDAQGDVVWINKVTGSIGNPLVISEASQLANGNFFFIGTSMGYFTNMLSNNIGEFDAAGNLVWTKNRNETVDLTASPTFAYNPPLSVSGNELVYTHWQNFQTRLTFANASTVSGNVCDFTDYQVNAEPLDYDYAIFNIPATYAQNAGAAYSQLSISLEENPEFEMTEVCNTTSANRPASSHGFGLWPSPASDFVFVENAAPAQLSIYNSLGQTVRTVQCEGPTVLDVREFNAGVYIAVLRDAKGSASMRFTVNR